MPKIVVALAWLACRGCGRRLHVTRENLESSPQDKTKWILDLDSLDMVPDPNAGDEARKAEAEADQKADEAESQRKAKSAEVKHRAEAEPKVEKAEGHALKEATARKAEEAKFADAEVELPCVFSHSGRRKRKETPTHFEKNASAVEEYRKSSQENALQIQAVQKNVDDDTVLIHELARRALNLSDDQVPLDTAHLQEALAVVEEAQQGVAQFTEHLVQDRLALSRSAGPSDENRQVCRDVFLYLEDLEEKVGITWNLLAAVHVELDSKVQLVQIRQSTEERAARIGQLTDMESDLSAKEVPSNIGRLKKVLATVGEAQEEVVELAKHLVQDMVSLVELPSLFGEDAEARNSAVLDIDDLVDKIDKLKVDLAHLYVKLEQARLEPLASARIKTFLEAPPPEKAFWSERKLEIDFELTKSRGSYSLLALIPGLNEEDLEILLSDDGQLLEIMGSCIPDAERSEAMREELVVYLREVSKTDPGCLADEIDGQKLYEELYAEMGKSKFGHFSRKHRLPKDADLGSLSFLYHDDMLVIIIPRERRNWPR